MNEAFIAALISAICTVESGGNPRAIHIDDGGSASLGLCQIKFTTAQEMGFTGNISELWLNPTVNRRYAEKYLRKQIKRYGRIDLAIAAYNSGSIRLAKDGHLKNQHYVDKVMKELQ